MAWVHWYSKDENHPCLLRNFHSCLLHTFKARLKEHRGFNVEGVLRCQKMIETNVNHRVTAHCACMVLKRISSGVFTCSKHLNFVEAAMSLARGHHNFYVSPSRDWCIRRPKPCHSSVYPLCLTIPTVACSVLVAPLPPPPARCSGQPLAFFPPLPGVGMTAGSLPLPSLREPLPPPLATPARQPLSLMLSFEPELCCRALSAK